MNLDKPLQIGALFLTTLLLSACGSTPSRVNPRFDNSSGNVPSRVSPELSTDVTIYAMGLVGTPYRYGGNTPDSGFDCSGLINHVYRTRAKLQPPRTVSQLQDWGQSVPRDGARTGDLVLFSPRNSPTHAGIYVGNGRFVHAPSTGGMVRLDRLDSTYWSRQHISFRRP